MSKDLMSYLAPIISISLPFFLRQDCKSEEELNSFLKDAESKAIAMLNDCKAKTPGVTPVGQETWRSVPV